jgi:hypothetical protein
MYHTNGYAMDMPITRLDAVMRSVTSGGMFEPIGVVGNLVSVNRS